MQSVDLGRGCEVTLVWFLDTSLDVYIWSHISITMYLHTACFWYFASLNTYLYMYINICVRLQMHTLLKMWYWSSSLLHQNYILDYKCAFSYDFLLLNKIFFWVCKDCVVLLYWIVYSPSVSYLKSKEEKSFSLTCLIWLIFLVSLLVLR